MEGYIFYSGSGIFQKCYSSCQFCSDISSSSSSHNCLSCKEGYLISYEHLGNCYKYENINTDEYIIINSVDEESFTQTESCGNYIIK